MSNGQNEKKVFTVGGDLTDFTRNQDDQISPTVENFYRFCSERKLMGVKCKSCGNVLVPPRLFCPKCHSSNLDWISLIGKGNLQTYSEVHIAPPDFQSIVPYFIGIVKLEEGVSLPGIIKLRKNEDIQIGMELIVDFETVPVESWPGSTRYYFKQP